MKFKFLKKRNQDEVCRKGKYLFEITSWVFYESWSLYTKVIKWLYMEKSYLLYTQMDVKPLDVDKNHLRIWVNNEELIGPEV